MANMPEHSIMQKLTPAERALIIRKRTRTKQGMQRVLDHWTAENATAIAERIKESNELGSTPLHLVPRDLLSRHIQIDKERLLSFAERLGEPAEIVRIARGGRPPLCVLWEVMQKAENEYGVRIASTMSIDYSQLPTRSDRDSEKLRYAEQVLEYLATLPRKFSRK